MPKLLKATYLADQEYLLEETRATKLFYFPGVIFWLIVFGGLSLLSAGAAYGWSFQWTAYSNGLSKFAGWINVNAGTFEKVVFFVFVLLFVIWLVRLFVRYLRWIRTVYAVTSRRVIVQRGILGKDFDEIPVTQVRGVDVHQSFGQRLLGYGTVRVSSEGGSRLGNEDWVGIPKPFRFQKLIENAVTNLQPTGPVQWNAPGQGRR
jgi:uncharacterized membrane protein YdbT with pleckstrin-like domain